MRPLDSGFGHHIVATGFDEELAPHGYCFGPDGALYVRAVESGLYPYFDRSVGSDK